MVPHGCVLTASPRPVHMAMRLTHNVTLRELTWKRSAARPLLSVAIPPCNRHRNASTSAAYPERIAILGGGVAGLSSAYFVAREFPKSKITVFEAGSNTGGWMKSKRVAVPGGDVIFEYGARTLRNATPTAHLVSWALGCGGQG
jgi:oxygen-dependent protoporphyrinogen oxidase